MSLPHTIRFGAVALTLFLGTLTLADLAAADDSFDFAPIHAPFECGTEWSGTTRPGHGLHDWNLDLNRTSRTYTDPQHDLGQPLLAQADGSIVWIGWHVSAGTYVEIDYGEITARYIHLVDGSVPGGLDIGSSVLEGEFFGELGDTGNASSAHLHLEYFDSRDYDDARAWLLPDENQIRIRMAGEIIDPGEVFVSTNCGGDPLPTTTTTTTTTSTTTTAPPPHPFTDVDPESFAHDDVTLLYELEITTGTSDTSYSPSDPVTREQMAAFLDRVWRLLAPPEPVLEPAHAPDPDPNPDPDPYPFDDLAPSSYAYGAAANLHRLGITTGTGERAYSPERDVDREQMGSFLARLFRLLGEEPAADDADPPFPLADIDLDSFALADIELLWRLGITTGTSETTYSPAHVVDREQMAAFLARIIRLLDPELAEPSDESAPPGPDPEG